MTVKCLVWDLDDTLWDGTLLEDGEVRVRPDAVRVLRTLDERGILHSIASRNDPDMAMAKLRTLGLSDYFLCPQIGWGHKSDAVKAVAGALNIGVDTLAFVDDQPYERDEVRSALPEVLCLDPAQIPDLPERSEFQPRFVTVDARNRRRFYQADQRRKQAEEAHTGPSSEFLASLGMTFSIAGAQEGDLQRLEELTVRTHQLNSTGTTYSYEELDGFRRSPDHELLVAELTDRYGGYGKIGLALVERGPASWTVKLLLMSCRVMTRGVGSVLLSHLVQEAHHAGVALHSEFLPTDRNRTMYITYKFAGFREVGRAGETLILENDFSTVQGFPAHLKVVAETIGRPTT
jgi:FkbH-like protein